MNIVLSNVTFFSREGRNKELKVGDKNRRKLIIELLETKELLSVNQLSAGSHVAYSTTYNEVDEFVKSGLVKPNDAGTYKRRRDAKFELTKDGILCALAVKVDEKLPMGEHIKDILLKVFQPERGTAPINYFMQTVLINAINRDLVDYVLRVVRNLVEAKESSPDPNIFKMAEKVITEAKPSEADQLGKAVIQALNSFTESEKNPLIQYLKSLLVSQLYHKSVLHGNAKQQALLTLSQENKDGIYIDFICGKCPYKNEQMFVIIEDVIIKIFTGGWKCPRCKRLVSDSRVERKGFRHHKIQVPAK